LPLTTLTLCEQGPYIAHVTQAAYICDSTEFQPIYSPDRESYVSTYVIPPNISWSLHVILIGCLHCHCFDLTSVLHGTTTRWQNIKCLEGAQDNDTMTILTVIAAVRWPALLWVRPNFCCTDLARPFDWRLRGLLSVVCIGLWDCHRRAASLLHGPRRLALFDWS
jgi:hypothetical protein